MPRVQLAAADRGVCNIIHIKKLQMQALLLSGLMIMTLLSLRTKPSPPSGLRTNPIMHINTQHAKSAVASVIHPPTRDEHDVATIRNYKFPSIQERFKYYMGSWANRTEWICSEDEIEVPPEPNGTSPLQWNRLPQLITVNDLKVCADNTKIKNVYCRDAYYVLSQASEGMNDKTAVLFVFGDRNNRSDKPFIIKSRSALPLFDPKQSIPIMWPLNMKRHYGPVDQYKSQVKDVGKEIEWSSKKSILFWRGAFTGSRGITLANWLQHNVPVPDAVDVGFTEVGPTNGMLDIKKDYPWAIKNATAIVDMQPYKYLLSLEGNDVASGLKWMLYSNSVVFMPTPTRTSWAMEDKLIPFTHYVPVAQDLSNLLEMIEWAKENDDIVQLISQKSTEYMEHLYVSDQAKLHHKELIVKLAKAYSSRFNDSLSDCLLLLGNKESVLDSYDEVNAII